jgi:hypothetical protein
MTLKSWWLYIQYINVLLTGIVLGVRKWFESTVIYQIKMRIRRGLLSLQEATAWRRSVAT